jgi:hypothetical protein
MKNCLCESIWKIPYILSEISTASGVQPEKVEEDVAFRV